MSFLLFEKYILEVCKMKVIDLSQTFENNMSQFPGTP
ncbi:cyclase family protein, partial [Bacillus thuringiensis]|nr:cyclase family protein [Bacillus thuringiensis]